MKVLNPELYEKIKNKLKKNKKLVWPSAYASGLLVQQYKAQGGKYSGTKPKKTQGIARWFNEKWVDVCYYPKIKDCGRKNTSKLIDYPKCRPLKRISKDTPMTVSEVIKKHGLNHLQKMCKNKRKHGLPKKGKPTRTKI